MSVAELLRHRQELADKMTEIDGILGQVVQVLGATPGRPAPVQPVPSTYDPAFGTPVGAGGWVSTTKAEDPSIPIGEVQPRAIPANTPNVDSGFSIFDVDSFNAPIVAASQQPQAQSEYNLEEMQGNIESLQAEIKEGIQKLSNNDDEEPPEAEASVPVPTPEPTL